MSYNPVYLFPNRYNKECKTTYYDKGTEEINESSEAPQRLKIFYYLSFCNRAIGFLLTTLIILWIFQYRGGVFFHHFNWHPLFMVFGMVYLYSRGMLFYRTERTIAMSRLKLMYARLMVAGAILIVTGLVAGLEKTDLQSAKSLETDQSTSNFYSLHSCVGWTSVILFFSQCAFDLFSCYFYPGVNEHQQSAYLRCRTYLTMATFIGAVVSCLLGFNEMVDFYENYSSENTIVWSICLTIIAFGGLSLYLYSSNSYNRSGRPDDEDLLTKAAVFKHLCCIPWSFQECTYSLRMIFSRPRFSPVLTSVDTH